jgi:hypothetical protein
LQIAGRSKRGGKQKIEGVVVFENNYKDLERFIVMCLTKKMKRVGRFLYNHKSKNKKNRIVPPIV